MKSSRMVVALILLLSLVGLAAGQQKSARQPAARIGVQPPRIAPMAGTLIVSPNPLTLPATNPATQPIASGTATYTYSIKAMQPWGMSVTAPATFSNCAGVPASAVTVSCVSVSGNKGEGSCNAGSWQLGTTPALVAQGATGPGNSTFTVTLSYTFNDDWSYIAASCNLPITYNVSGL